MQELKEPGALQAAKLHQKNLPLLTGFLIFYLVVFLQLCLQTNNITYP